jgi:putative lipoic acid-binding regulatory protein
VSKKSKIEPIIFDIKNVYLPLIFFDKMDKKTEEFYIRLKEELASTSEWPSEYIYKFIVPTDATKIVEVEQAFDNMGAVIKTTPSKTGKYTSVSINVCMQNPDHVVEKYLEVSTIEGIISF